MVYFIFALALVFLAGLLLGVLASEDRAPEMPPDGPDPQEPKVPDGAVQAYGHLFPRPAPGGQGRRAPHVIGRSAATPMPMPFASTEPKRGLKPIEPVIATPGTESGDMLGELEACYVRKGLWPRDFSCQHFARCSAGQERFTQAKCSFVGPEYVKGTLPRLVFLSLDSGDGDANPETRTFEAVRRTELGRDVSRLHKGRHWYITHEFSLRLLGQFQPALSIDTVLPHIAHVNTVKCSANLPHRSQAPPQMYRNCRHHIFEELCILQPDILVSQGAEARKAVEDLFRCAPFHPLEAEGATGGLGLLHGLHDRNTLWIQMHHPSARGGVFQKQKEHMWPRYVSSARRFVEAREL